MKLAISNIAWEIHDHPPILQILKDNNVSGIEVAPTKIWPDWEGACYKEAKKYRDKMDSLGFQLPAMQAILFGKPKLQVFDTTTHKLFLEHITKVAEIANGLGSKVLVFGSPKNRKRGQIPYSTATDIAADFFYQASQICKTYECSIGLEHNPVEYGCDFVTNLFDAKELVEKVNHANFQLHIDSAGIHMCGGDIAKVITQAGKFVHFHISEPMLEPIYKGVVNHNKAIDTLRSINYQQWVSIEMKQPSNINLVEKSLQQINLSLKSCHSPSQE